MAIAGGLRYGQINWEESWSGRVPGHIWEDFSGLGPVIEVEATRPLFGPLGVYGELRQAILFGEFDGANNNAAVPTDRDGAVSMTEIGVGFQYQVNAGWLECAFVRLGVEGRFWSVDYWTGGLFGGVLKVGARF